MTAVADSRGRAVAFHLAPGQAHERPSALALLSKLPGAPAWVVADRGYSSDGLRAYIGAIGAQPAVPTKRGEAPARCPDFIQRHRNRIERMWGRLKEWRAIATQDETTAPSLMSVPCLAATMDQIKN